MGVHFADTSIAMLWIQTGFQNQAARLPSAALQGPGKLSKIWPGIFDFEPDLSLMRGQTKPKVLGMVPTDRHTQIPSNSGTISVCFDDDPTLLSCEIFTGPLEGVT